MGWQRNTLLINSGDNWAYAFVQFNENAQHMPLPKEGHLSAMIDGTPSRKMCGHLHQLDVWQLLQCRDHVVYPKGLNGGLEPVLTSLSGALVQGGNVLGVPTCKPSYQWTSPSLHWGITCLKSQLPAKHLHPLPPSCLTIECTPEADSHISMTTEVWKLLPCAVLDTSSQASGDSLQKGPTSSALGVSSPPGRKAPRSQ